MDAVRETLDGYARHARRVADGAAEAERELERAEQELDTAVRAFTGLEDVDAARDRLLELRELATVLAIGSPSYRRRRRPR